MPTCSGLAILLKECRLLAGKRVSHEPGIEGKRTDHNTQGEHKSDSVRAERVLPESGLGDERIEGSHQQTADDAQDNAASTNRIAGLSPAIRQSIQKNRG